MPNNYGVNSSTLQEGSTKAHAPMHYEVNHRICEKSRQLRNPTLPCQTVTTGDTTRHQEQNGDMGLSIMNLNRLAQFATGSIRLSPDYFNCRECTLPIVELGSRVSGTKMLAPWLVEFLSSCLTIMFFQGSFQEAASLPNIWPVI